MNEIAGEVLAILRRYLSDPTSRSLLSSAARRASVRLETVTRADVSSLVRELGPGLNIFLQEPEKLQNCKSLLALVATESSAPIASSGGGGGGGVFGGFDHHHSHARDHAPTESRADGISVPIRAEHDVVRARTLGKDMAKQLGFSDVVQTKVATAVSELARNIFQYAGTGEVRIRRIEGKRRGIEIVARDQGPGISDPALILSGQYRSKWGMGAGLRGTKRLVDEFELDTHPGLGTTVRIRKYAE
jgi:serine/threonine-protein kinase RsbT